MKNVLKNKGKKLKLTTLGFTLIELLGVIIILALLVILVFPSIINSVRDSSKKTDDLTLQLIYNAADLYIDNHKKEFYKNEGNQYSIEFKDLISEGLLASPIKLSESDDDLTELKCIQVTYNDGFNYELKNAGSCKTKYADGQIVYYDVLKGKVCTNYHEDNSITGYNGIANKNSIGNSVEKLETQTSCLKFYLFNDDGGEKINLLLDHNSTEGTAWESSNDNSDGPISLLDRLNSDTKEWSNEIVTPNNYNFQGELGSYVIDYSGYRARLITAQEVAQITGADKALNWEEYGSTSSYYLDGANGENENWSDQVANETNKSKYYWLFDRTKDCISYGCNVSDSSDKGYWTSTALSSVSFNAWLVNNEGKMTNGALIAKNGVRPVIIIKRSNLFK